MDRVFFFSMTLKARTFSSIFLYLFRSFWEMGTGNGNERNLLFLLFFLYFCFFSSLFRGRIEENGATRNPFLFLLPFLFLKRNGDKNGNEKAFFFCFSFSLFFSYESGNISFPLFFLYRNWRINTFSLYISFLEEERKWNKKEKFECFLLHFF